MTLSGQLLHLLFIVSGIFIASDSYRILGIFPLRSKSHNNMFEALMKGLAKKGHKVDIITHFELKDHPNNYRIIINWSDSVPFKFANTSIDFVSQVNADSTYFFATYGANKMCNLLSNEELQKFIKNPSHKYDLVITEAFAYSCFYGIGYVLKAPVITVSTMIQFPWTFVVGNPDSTSFVPNIFFESATIETFFQRLKNTIMLHFSRYRFNKFTQEFQMETMRKYLSPDIPDVQEVEKSVALMFTNSHYTIHGVRPLTPAVISIAGLHVEQNEDVLSFEFSKWMDESVHGVIYFTFGSMFIIESLPRSVLLKFYEAFSAVSPVRVLMKVINENMLPPGLPENVRLFSWLPQIPILKHNNTKVFITHGGLMGIQEALYYGVPMIGMPLNVDQFININMFVKKNMSLRVDHEKLTAEDLINALKSMLYDSNYRKVAMRESRLFRDRPMSSMDTVIFWVEYIIRNGAKSLRSPAVDLYWWQVELLDVYLFLTFSFVVILCVFGFLIKKIVYVLYNIRTSSQMSKKDN